MSSRSYTPAMTHAPITEAYLERMARRDDPADHSVCEHNWEVANPLECPDCHPRHRRSPHHE